MKSAVILTGLFFLLSISLVSQTQASEVETKDDVFIFVQTTIRNPDGQLVTYLESSKFTNVNLDLLGPFLDYEATRGNDPIVTLDGKEYQVIRRVQSKTFDRDDLVASTTLSDVVNGQLTMIARFAHDGYPVSEGDTMQSMWTFVRPVS